MNPDMDLDRDHGSAFGPASVVAGALLPFEGRTFLRSPEGVPPRALEVDGDGWLSPDTPILVRGSARILPLAWAGDGTGATQEEISAFASQMQDAGLYWAGNWRVIDELAEHRGDSIGSYLSALRAAGATRANFWTFSDTVGFALVWVDSDDGAVRSLALHVVPAAWVSERHVKKPVRGIDLRWSWSDVVALSGARDTSAAGIPAEQRTEGRES